MTITADREWRLNRAFDVLVDNPEGMTVSDIASEVPCTKDQAYLAVHDLRHVLGETDEINVPADPNGRNEEWTYRLVGTLDEARGWAVNRMLDTKSRIRTQHLVMQSLCKALDGRTVEGRSARTFERKLRHLLEDLDAMAGEA